MDVLELDNNNDNNNLNLENIFYKIKNHKKIIKNKM